MRADSSRDCKSADSQQGQFSRAVLRAAFPFNAEPAGSEGSCVDDLSARRGTGSGDDDSGDEGRGRAEIAQREEESAC